MKPSPSLPPDSCRSRTLAPAVLAVVLGVAPMPTAFGGLLLESVYGGHTYQVWGDDGVFNDQYDFSSAVLFASTLSLGDAPGSLVRIDSAEENEAVFQMLSTVSGSWGGPVPDGGNARYAWIGAMDLGTEGDWQWTDNGDSFWSGTKTGSSVGGRYQNWAVGSGGSQSEPDDFFFSQDAAAMVLDPYPVANPGLLGLPGQWNDLNVGNQLMLVVEFAAVPEPAAAAAAWAAALGVGGWLWRRVRVRARASGRGGLSGRGA